MPTDITGAYVINLTLFLSVITCESAQMHRKPLRYEWAWVDVGWRTVTSMHRDDENEKRLVGNVMFTVRLVKDGFNWRMCIGNGKAVWWMGEGTRKGLSP